MSNPLETAPEDARRRRIKVRGLAGAAAVLVIVAAVASTTGGRRAPIAVSAADAPPTSPFTDEPAGAGVSPADVSPSTIPTSPSPGPLAELTPTAAAAVTTSTVRAPVVASPPRTPRPPVTTPVASPARSVTPTVTGLYVIDADSGVLRRLATGRVYDPVWSPDGSRLVFVRDNQLVVVSSDGTAERVIASPATPLRPAWSPDGTRVAFIRGGAVFVVPLDSGDAHQVGDGGACAVAWSPDGERIGFASMAVMRSTLETVRPDGTDRHVVVTSISCDGRAVWSPDSTRIGYLDFNIGPAVVDVATGTKTPLTTQRNMGWPMTWAPGGEEIAFADYLGTTNNLSIARADGSGVKTIASGAVAPDWSPNGSRIAFQGNRNPDRTGELLTHLYVIDAGGQGERILVTDTRTTHVDAPVWAPDSVHIAFSFTA